jgi:hypothetical protein
MDLHQTKLTRTEWDSIEVPVSDSEKEILNMILEGFKNPSITKNKTMSLFSFTKIEQTPENEVYLYNKYFAPIVDRIIRKYGESLAITAPTGGGGGGGGSGGGHLKKMKSIDLARVQNLEATIDIHRKNIFEFLVLEFCLELAKNLSKGNSKYAYYLYTLIQLSKASIRAIHPYITLFMTQLTDLANAKTELANIVERAFVFIEQNPYLLEYEDKTLFPHQKELFAVFRRKSTEISRLVLYIAPTGTGKTLSPLGLSVQYRVIFVCVARHIGLALAKAAISIEKKIAFAFGAETASDIRLHWFAASDFTKDRRSGGIRKVNNSIGDKVEIMICDVQSYLIAMRYMLAFNQPESIITYWDEPTITMDYPEHELHSVIHQNWVENKIPNIVLSCATLPHENEILDTIADFKSRFDNAEITSIHSYDCRKSIPIVTKDGLCALPHTMYPDYDELVECVRFCAENKTLLRYFDLAEIVRFIFFVTEMKYVPEKYHLNAFFKDIAEITMNSLKLYYLEVLQHIPREHWQKIFEHMKSVQKPKFADVSSLLRKSASLDSTSIFKSGTEMRKTHSICGMNAPPLDASKRGILLTTKDAHTLTAGPTIYLTEDASKIGRFYIQQSEIPQILFQEVMTKIDSNNKISCQLEELENELDLLTAPDPDKKTKQKEKDDSVRSPVIKEVQRKIDGLRKQIRLIAMDSEYVPNTKAHQMKWMGSVEEQAFCPNIDENAVKEIMSLPVDSVLKILMLMGIGLFIEGVDARYLELMKRLASQQELYIIIASSDYVFGTNYNFCHGFIGKDMANMTPAKTIQCLGRIGRSAIQSTYTARFRDDEFIYQLFKMPEVNREAVNMSKLFSSDL